MSDSLDPVIDAIDDAARGFVAVDGSDQEFARYEERLDAASAELTRLRARCAQLEAELKRMVSAHSIDVLNPPRFCPCGACDAARAALREADDA